MLKGHIGIATARFPKGTRGIDLDPFARRALWEAGLDFDHGTGHGVGSYLSVHEGPQSISKRGMTVLEPGMIISNEPGYYKEGAYGIRIENLVLVTRAGEGGRRRSRGDGLRDADAGAHRPAAGACRSCCRRRSWPGSTPITRGCGTSSARSSAPPTAPGSRPPPRRLGRISRSRSPSLHPSSRPQRPCEACAQSRDLAAGACGWGPG